MSKKTESVVRCVCCAIATMLVVLLGVPAGGPAASAQAGYRLSIVKTDGEVGQQGTPLPGAQFRINRVPELWGKSAAELNALAVENPLVLTSDSPYPMDSDLVATTGTDGIAHFNNLPAGVYLIREIPTRLPNENKPTISPLLVSVPEGRTEHVIVRPKNQPLVIDKYSNKEIAVHREDIVFTVRANAPDVDCYGGFTQYIVVDGFERELDFQRVAEVRITEHFPQTLIPGADWEVQYDPEIRTASLIFTTAGLAKLATARTDHPETRVEVDFVAQFNETAVPGEYVSNAAYLFADGADYSSLGRCLIDMGPAQLRTPDVPVYRFAHINSDSLSAFMPIARVINPNCLRSIAFPSEIIYVQVKPTVPPTPNPAGPGYWWIPLIGLIPGLIAGGSLSSELSSTPTPQPGSANHQDSALGKAEALVEKIGSQARGLANTGASVVGLVLFALFIAIVGWLLLAAGKRRHRDEEDEQ